MALTWLSCPRCHIRLSIDDASDSRPERCQSCGAALNGPADGWFYVENRQKVGPVTLQQLRELATAGRLKPS